MFNLLKSDLKRILRDKLFMVLCIIALVFAIITPLLYFVLFQDVVGVEIEMMGMIINAKTVFFSSFSLGNNLGLIAPILLAIIICKDFSHGTIRNKIICGKTRTSIFFSYVFAMMISLFGVVMIHALISLGFCLLFFEYQSTPFTIKDFGYIFASIGIETIIYFFISCLLCFLCILMKNAGLTIVCYVAVNFIFIIVGSIISVALLFVEPSSVMTVKILTILSDMNVFTTTLIGAGSSYTLANVLCLTIPYVFASALLLFFGRLIFNKKNLK